MNRNYVKIILVVITLLVVFPAIVTAAEDVFRTGGLVPVAPEIDSAVTVEVFSTGCRFTVEDERVSTLRLRILDRLGNELFDSGLSTLTSVSWDAPELLAAGPGQYYYELAAWDPAGEFAGAQTGGIDLHPEDMEGPAVFPLSFDVAGNFTIGGFLGVGLGSPERAVHIRGANSVFRMDRSKDTAAFMICRTDTANNVLKSFVVGVNASGPNQGTFVVNDLGAATTGGGINRLTIDNTGNAIFAREVRASAFISASSRALKTDIRPLDGALDSVMRLQGVRFNWKDTGAPAIGFIAEEVARVVPEVVAYGENGKDAKGVDYGKLTAVLVEAAKSQQQEIEQLRSDCDALQARWEAELKELRAGDAGR